MSDTRHIPHQGSLPDFMCIGAQKAGTTWFYHQVRAHPEICVPRKEIGFFDEDGAVEEYIKEFQSCPDGLLSGDVSPSYSAYPESVERIAAICPQAKLVFFLREPVSRAWSQWKMARRLKNFAGQVSFKKAVMRDRGRIRTRGEYARIIREFSRFYPYNERLKVYFMDDIRNRPGEMMSEIFTFLGVDPGWQPQTLDAVYHAGSSEPCPAKYTRWLLDYYRPLNLELRGLLRQPLPNWLSAD